PPPHSNLRSVPKIARSPCLEHTSTLGRGNGNQTGGRGAIRRFFQQGGKRPSCACRTYTHTYTHPKICRERRCFCSPKRKQLINFAENTHSKIHNSPHPSHLQIAPRKYFHSFAASSSLTTTTTK
ncbi:unnamed protein product, partial [Ectocarpus sp. 6 AP-2014]